MSVVPDDGVVQGAQQADARQQYGHDDDVNRREIIVDVLLMEGTQAELDAWNEHVDYIERLEHDNKQLTMNVDDTLKLAHLLEDERDHWQSVARVLADKLEADWHREQPNDLLSADEWLTWAEGQVRE